MIKTTIINDIDCINKACIFFQIGGLSVNPIEQV